MTEAEFEAIVFSFPSSLFPHTILVFSFTNMLNVRLANKYYMLSETLNKMFNTYVIFSVNSITQFEVYWLD